MENLLSTYERIERSFMMTVYELHKAFNFRTLWEGNDPLAEFRRVARESASGTGRLNGMIQLSNVLTKVEDLETKAVKCFTTNRYSTGIKKWAFSKAQNTAVSNYHDRIIALNNKYCYIAVFFAGLQNCL